MKVSVVTADRCAIADLPPGPNLNVLRGQKIGSEIPISMCTALPLRFNITKIINGILIIDRNVSQWIKSQLKFAPLDAQQIHQDLKYQKEKNTGSWILENKIFQEWQNTDNPSQILALEGISKCFVLSHNTRD
jgi:hypothetical protein